MLGLIISPALFPSGYFFYAFFFFSKTMIPAFFLNEQQRTSGEGGREREWGKKKCKTFWFWMAVLFECTVNEK